MAANAIKVIYSAKNEVFDRTFLRYFDFSKIQPVFAKNAKYFELPPVVSHVA